MRKRKIVVVEDDPELRDLEMFLLSAEGYEVVGVSSGNDAASVIQREQADLVLLDLMLPGKDGNTVLDELGDIADTSAIPVIVVSAFLAHLRASPQVRRVIAKPFDVLDLLDATAHELTHPNTEAAR